MRSLDQNGILHVWCRDIAEFLKAGGIENVSETTVKELLKATLGNTVEILGTRVPMPTSKYKKAEHELTPAELKRDFISFDQFLTKIQAYAATDLNLILESPNEPDMVNK